MTEKPDPIECSICGEMIEPFWDSGRWCFGAGAISLPNEDGTFTPVPGQFHHSCFEHADLWKRIRALEKK